ncbi:MAG: site-specific integrase [Acidobacteria bacterium]|nr:site-specific integrase [Acidobacteriota bacterium]
MLTYAMDKGYLETHPLYRFRLLHEERRALRILTVEEFRALVSEVSKTDPVIGVFTAMLGETALRKAEGLRLKWGDINMARRMLTVSESKSGLPRYVPLSEFAMQQLALLPRAIRCSHVFIRMQTLTPWKDPYGPFRLGKKVAGLDWIGGFHDLRHFRATQWLANGVDVRTVSELLGHSTLAMTTRYVHYLQAHAFEAVRKAEQRETAAIGGRKVDENWTEAAESK